MYLPVFGIETLKYKSKNSFLFGVWNKNQGHFVKKEYPDFMLDKTGVSMCFGLTEIFVFDLRQAASEAAVFKISAT